ncbi:MAG: choice-of-anchor L domain-containing protein [Saprospiraceae bacterium]
MKRFLLPTTTILILFLSTAFTFEPDTKNDFLNCTLDDVILNLSEPVERIKFVLPEGGINSVVLCDLKIGKTYDLYLVDVTSACGIPAEFEGNAVGSEMYLQITPTATCHDLSIHNFCDFKKPVRLSVFEQGNGGGSNISTGADMVPITTNGNYTATELIEDVFIGGGCFDVTNVTSIGSSTGIGAFSNGLTSIGFDEGVVISSGNIATVSGPNNSGSAGAATGGGSDPDLQQLNSQSIFDATGIEFDFSPTLATIDFRFVFGSEEYCEFVNASVNDVFGFFISGPGITGPFSNNSANLALIPMTNIPISIDDVNNNSNPTYFVPNSTSCGGITNAADIQFDGYTVALTATANVIPCETYHIKLVVGDGGDAIYDSGVFLEAGSFNAGGQATVSAINASTGTSLVYEDCGDAFITFTRQTGDLSLPLVITYTIDPSSTATNLVDYAGLPPSITIPAGQTEVTIPLTIFSDGIPEGLETIIINMDNSCSCNNSTATIEIQDVPPLIVDPMVDQVLCGPETVTLASGISGGVPPLTYNWSTGATTATISEFVPSNMTYTVTVMDACGNSVQDDVMVEVGTTPTAFISGIGDICPPGNPVAVIQIDFTGLGPWDVIYSINGIPQIPITGIIDNPYFLPVSEVGNYTITQLMVNGCPGPGSGIAVITETIIAPVAVGMDISCWGFNDGSINVFPTGGQGPYVYSWNNPFANGENPTNLPAGDYTVTVYDDNGCTGLTSVTLEEPDPIILAAVGNPVDCGDPNSGSIDLTINGGTFPYATIWSNGSSSEDPTGLPTGTYTVTVTDLGGCFVTTTAVVEDNNDPPLAVANAPDPLSCTNTQVTINGNGSSTGSDYTYLWTTSDGTIISGENSLTPTVGAGGTYQILVTNTTSGCTEIATVIVTESADLPDAFANAPMELDCNNMQISIDGNGSSTGSDFTYLWTTSNGNIVSGNTSLNPTINQAGTYQIQVTNSANGCTQIATVTVAENTTPPIADAGTNQMLDCNTTTISLSGAASSSGANYTYLWTTSNGLIVDGETTLFPNVESAGTYQIEVTDQTNGCTSVATVEVTSDSNVPTAVAGTAANLTCSVLEITLDGTGSSSGTGYTYLWTTSNGTIVNNETTLNPTISATGTYQIMVTAPNGCTQIATVMVGENTTPPIADAGLEMTIDCGVTTISLDGSNSSSGSGFTYEWTTSGGNIVSGETTLNPSVDAAGGYILTVTNTANGCTSTASTNVNSSADLPAANAGAPQTLDCGILEVTLDGSGSEVGPNITYLWTTSDGNIVSGNNGINPIVDGDGTYQILVTDTDNGCTAISTVTVDLDNQAPVAMANAPTQLSCNSSSVSLDGNGSSSGGNFTYEWTTSNGSIVSGENSLTPEVNAAGTYQIMVTNTDNGCTEIASVNVLVNGDLPSANAGIADDLTCVTNQISLNGNGSIGTNFTYLWTTLDGNIVSGNNDLNPSVNAVGTYQLLVTDTDNGCTAISTVLVEEDMESPDVSAVTPSSLTCIISSVDLSATNNGTGTNYTYLWTTSNGNIVSGENGLTPTVNATGNYVLEITNTTNGCISTISVDVPIDDQEPTASAGANMEVTCSETEVTLDGSGSDSGANFTYLWTTSNGNIISGEDSSNPIVGATGTYQILVTNTITGCTSIADVFVDEDIEDPIAAAGLPQTLSCASTSTQLNGNGSSFGSNFTYEWTTSDGNILSGENTLTPEINAPGEYQILVTNTDNGCVATEVVTVSQDSNAPIAEAGLDDLLNCNITSLILDASGSSQGLEFTYEWTTSNGNIVSGGTTLNPEINAPGDYQLVVSNVANGCSTVSSLVIDIDDETPTAEAGLSQFLSCTNSSLTLDGTGSSAGTDFTYQWVTSNGNIVSGENSLTPEVNATGTYELIVTSGINGCTISDEVEITQDSSLPVANAGDGFEITCQVFDGTLDGSASTINNDITFEWTTTDGNIVSGANSLTPFVDEAGVYQLTLTNITNGCTAISSATVIENNEAPDVEAGATMELNCNNENLSIIGSTSNISTNFIYEWTTTDGNIISGNNDLIIDIDSAGMYQLMITNTVTGCVSTDEVMITSNFTEPTADAGATDELNCTETFATLDGNGSSLGANFIYQWTTSNGNIVTGDNTLNPEINMPGDYQILVTDLVNGCTAIESVFISQNITPPIADAGLANDLTCIDLFFDLDGSNSSTGTDFEYLWTTTNGNILMGDNTLNPTIDEPGIYEIQVTNTTNNCVSTAEITVDQNIDTPTADAGLQAQLTCTVTETQLDGNNSSSGNNITYQWITLDGSIISDENTTTPTIGGTGTYELIVTNTISGCTANAFVEVVADGNIPNAEAIPMGVLTCDENTVSLSGNGSSNGTNFTYEWSTTNGNIVSGETSITPVVNQTGEYTLLVTNIDNGCSNETTITVEEDLSPPVATIDQTINISLDCDVSSIVLDGSGSQPIGNVSYSWTTIGGNILSGANTANPEVDDEGEYILTVTNLINGCTETQSIFIQQDVSVPQVNIAPPLMLTCDLTETNLDAGNSSQGNYSYQWTTTNGTIVSGATTLTPLINQIGTYQLVVTDLGSNCTNEASITVLENTTPPIAEAGIADMLDCQTTSVSLNGTGSSSGPNFIYEWSTGNGNFIGGTTTISTEVNFAGSYNLEVTNTQNGCTAIDFVIVEEDINTPSGIIYDIDLPECHGDQGSIIIETVDGGTAPYVYSIDGVNYYSGHIFTIEAGNYTLFAQDALGCETQIDFEIPELAPVEILLDSEATIDLGDDYQIESFTNIPANNIESISWTPSHHLSCDDCLNPKVEQLFENATYTLTIINNNGCKVSAKININVDKARAIYIPNVFTPNGDGENDIFMIYAGDLNQIKQVNTFMIYDRWGETIFRAADFGPMDPQNGWDGTFKGETMNPQVFVYWAEIEFIDGLKVMYKGDVALRK